MLSVGGLPQQLVGVALGDISASSSTAATAPATSPPKPSSSTAEIGGRQPRLFCGAAATTASSPTSLDDDLDVLAGRQPVGRGEAVEDPEALLAEIGEGHLGGQLGDAVAGAARSRPGSPADAAARPRPG